MKLVILAALAALLTGCANYMANRDTVTLGVGNAMEANVGIHTVNPFPPDAHDTTIYTSGGRVQRAMETYSGTPLGRGGGSTSAVRIARDGLPGMGPGRKDIDCKDVGGPVAITGSDPDGLDADNDGTGCEDYNR